MLVEQEKYSYFILLLFFLQKKMNICDYVCDENVDGEGWQEWDFSFF